MLSYLCDQHLPWATITPVWTLYICSLNSHSPVPPHQQHEGDSATVIPWLIPLLQVFLSLTVMAVASANPDLLVGHGLAHHGLAHHSVAHPLMNAVGGQTTHQSVSTAHGEQRSLVQSKAFGATHSSVAQSDNSKGLSEIQPSFAANRPVPVGHAAVVPLAHAVAHPIAHHGLTHAVHAAPLAHHAVAHAPLAHAVHAAPLAHAAPVAHAFHAAPVAHAVHAVHAPLAHAVHAAPLVAHAVHAAPAGYAAADLAEVSPYTYNYGVADDYSKAAFSQEESNDGTGVVSGSYSVNLPDGRIQTVNYHANDIDGYVAEVSYSGEAQYPAAVAHPVVAHAVHAAPVAALVG